MTAIDPRGSGVHHAGVDSSPESTRLERRTALDLSIDEELVRGEVRGEALSSAQRHALSVLVEHELTRIEPLTEARFLAALPGVRVFGSRRRGRLLAALVHMNLARRDGASVHATVAGVAAVLHVSTAPERRPPQELLRALRRIEISSIRL
ncbi:hypothetical protein [Microbacterium sp. SD291]|uniref:hypothetical protein n=1 Tax=Microbacterium sp. SD291 TaxID=2782007 RepID=UPI001A95DA32|nr:hypothetical protein [Microbacterium sp. SD291]MBO0981784.1 hypothetical protein [Microbacterium sp. SD291]